MLKEDMLVTCSFAMVVINNRLALVGGNDSNNELSMWEAGSRKWTRPYEHIPAARGWPSAVLYQQWLIVAGGWTGGHRLLTGEVLDVASNQWYSAPSTPTPWSGMRRHVVPHGWS